MLGCQVWEKVKFALELTCRAKHGACVGQLTASTVPLCKLAPEDCERHDNVSVFVVSSTLQKRLITLEK